MSEGTNNLLEKAVQEMNETDAKGAVGQIKNLIRGINANDEKIAVLVKHVITSYSIHYTKLYEVSF